MDKQDFSKAYGLVRKFAKSHGRSPIGYDYEGRMGLSDGFFSDACIFVQTEMSGGRFYLDATDEQASAARAAIAAFAAREIAIAPAVRFLSADDSYDYN